MVFKENGKIKPDAIQKKLQKMFRDFGIFFSIKAGEEKTEDLTSEGHNWERTYKRKKKNVRNASVVGAFILLFLQKANASGGKISLAFLPKEESDDVICYETIFKGKADLDRTFAQFYMVWELYKTIDNYCSSDISEEFPFLYYGSNIMLCLVGFYYYLDQNKDKRKIAYSENEVRDFLLSREFNIDKYFRIDRNKKEAVFTDPAKLNGYLNLLVENIDDILRLSGIQNNPKKVISYFKQEKTIFDIAERVRPKVGLRELY